jgi:hypothetical protein
MIDYDFLNWLGSNQAIFSGFAAGISALAAVISAAAAWWANAWAKKSTRIAILSSHFINVRELIEFIQGPQIRGLNPNQVEEKKRSIKFLKFTLPKDKELIKILDEIKQKVNDGGKDKNYSIERYDEIVRKIISME